VEKTSIVWFRRDLRLADNDALAGALAAADTVVPIWAAPHPAGSGEDHWLAHSLRALDTDLSERGSNLTTRTGPAAIALVTLAREHAVRSVHCTRVWTPEGLAEEREVASALETEGVRLVVTEGSFLVPPDALKTGTGGPYRVFTPYFRSWEQVWGPSEPQDAPLSVPGPGTITASDPLPDRRGGAPDTARWWTPGEAGAHARLATFVDEALADYAEERDLPSLDSTSRLSPHLAFGEISPRQIVAAVTRSGLPAEVTRPFVRQLSWREFAAHVLHHHPHMLTEPLRPEFAAMPWRDDPDAFAAWREGRTGYPLVDAGMRQLAATGWMHNRVRLVAASFLTKHLLLPWQAGERFFAEMLIDFDVASNVFNWQWVAGCGADAAPYFRIFNPTLQAARFDPDGKYIRRWVPELEHVPARWIAEPWRMSPAEAAEAEGVRAGIDYPAPIVEHREARERALAAYSALKG
jgi:deoxyribodipyrimidine photo-lyase